MKTPIHLLLLCLALWLLPGFTFAQGNSNYTAVKDSLLKLLPTLEGQAKLDTYEALGQQLYFNESDAEVALPIFDAWEQEASKQDDKKLQRRVMYLALGILVNRRHYDVFLERVGRVLAFYETNGFYDKQYYAIHNSRLFVLFELGRFGESLNEAKLLYQAAKKRGDAYGETTALLRMGETYCSLRRLAEAETSYRECLALQGKDSSDFNHVSSCYLGLVDILLQQKRNSEALEVLPLWEASIRKHDEAAEVPALFNWKQFYLMTAYVYNRTGDTQTAVDYLQKSDSIPTSYNGLENNSFRSFIRASILSSQKRYDEALQLLEVPLGDKDLMVAAGAMEEKAAILCHAGQGEEALPLFVRSQEIKDSISNLGLVAQLDEFRIQYEVDRHIAEKERQRMYFYFALGGCCLLILLLAGWIYYNRKVARKNRALVRQIKEMIPENETICPDTRKDQLCLVIREAILTDKLYLNPTITRDEVIARLGTSKNLFIEAFQYCFGMSFNDYITMLRLKSALILLQQSDLSILEISEQSGFGTVRTFRRQFNEKYGMSPADYRKLQKQ